MTAPLEHHHLEEHPALVPTAKTAGPPPIYVVLYDQGKPYPPATDPVSLIACVQCFTEITFELASSSPILQRLVRMPASTCAFGGISTTPLFAGIGRYSLDYGIEYAIPIQVPPTSPGGTWNKTVLVTLDGTNGGEPNGGLQVSSRNVVYGTTSNGGLYAGEVLFFLTPPQQGEVAWTYTVLREFDRITATGLVRFVG